MSFGLPHHRQLCHSTRQGKQQLLRQQQQLPGQQRPAPRSIKTLARTATTSTASGAASPVVPMRRKAWHITQQGDMDSLQLKKESMPALLPGHVLVEVKAWGLNFADVFCALGLYKAAPKGDFIPGRCVGMRTVILRQTDNGSSKVPELCSKCVSAILQKSI
jgi:hypothetical protein